MRYKQTAIGIAWVVLQPLAAAAIFTVIFGRLAQLPSEGIPYAVFVFSGVVLWNYFSGAVDLAAQSLVQQRDLVTKVAFPRLLAPLAAILPGLVDLAVSLVLVAVFMVAYGVVPSLALLTLPLWIVATATLALGAGACLSALNVRYRDVRHTLGFLIQVWFFATPIVFSPSLIEGSWRFVFGLNPMVGVVEGYRWSLLAAPAPGIEALVSLGSGLLLVVGGIVYFRRAEQGFVDVI